MDTCKIQQLIVCDIARRGTGKPDSPIRAITQIFAPDGELIAEDDPTGTISVYDAVAMLNHFSVDKKYTDQDVRAWIELVSNKRL